MPARRLVNCWMAWGGIDSSLAPDDAVLATGFAEPDVCRPPGRPQRHRRLGEPSRLPPARGSSRLAAALRRPLPRRAADPPDHRDRPDGPLRTDARLVDPARKLVRAGQPEHGDRLRRSGATTGPAAAIPIFVSGDEQTGTTPRIIARSFEEWFLDCSAREAANTGSTRVRPISATPGRRTAGTPPQPELPESAPPVRRAGPSAGGRAARRS